MPPPLRRCIQPITFVPARHISHEAKTMNTEQFQNQQKAAAAIEAGVTDLARQQVKLASLFDVAVDAAAEVIGTHYTEVSGGYILHDGPAKMMRDDVAGDLRPAFDGIVKKLGPAGAAAISDDVFAGLGTSYAERYLQVNGHQITDSVRGVQKRLEERHRREDGASAVPAHLPASTRPQDHIALQHNPNPVPLASAADVLKNIESIEQNARSKYPAKKARR
jgi:hypothetical protein